MSWEGGAWGADSPAGHSPRENVQKIPMNAFGRPAWDFPLEKARARKAGGLPGPTYCLCRGRYVSRRGWQFHFAYCKDKLPTRTAICILKEANQRDAISQNAYHTENRVTPPLPCSSGRVSAGGTLAYIVGGGPSLEKR
jgi:hypothetical protein